MGRILEPQTLVLFLFFVVPGFITVRTYDLIVPSERRNFGESFIDIIAYSFVVLAISVWPFLWVVNHQGSLSTGLYYLLFALTLVLVFFITPVGVAMLYHWVRTRDYFKDKVVQPSPTGWDWFFGGVPTCYVLFHLKSEEVVGGFYGGKSSASSYPQEQQVYVEEIWDLNDDLEFVRKRPNTAGAIINREDCNLIELFFEAPERGERGEEDK